MVCRLHVSRVENQKTVTLPKPTERVDMTLRLGPAAKRQQCQSVVTSKENQVLTSLKEFFVDLEEGCFDNRSEGVTVCTNPTLSVSITIAPEAPAIFPSNQLRSHGLSSGHATICESHTARRCPR